MSEDDRIVWRYMDLAKYLCLLSRGLFFTRATEFRDRWEGAWPVEDVRQFRDQNTSLDREAIASAWSARYETKRGSLRSVGVSCWHLSSYENPAFWELYARQGLGVALQSTVEKVRAALAPRWP